MTELALILFKMYKVLCKLAKLSPKIEIDFDLISSILNTAQDYVFMLGNVRLYLMLLSLFVDEEKDILLNKNVKLKLPEYLLNKNLIKEQKLKLSNFVESYTIPKADAVNMDFGSLSKF